LKKVFTDWLKDRDYCCLESAFRAYLEDIGIYQGEDYTNINDTFKVPNKPKEDRWDGFPPLIL